MPESVLPSAIEAERAVLCAMLIDREVLSLGLELLQDDDFFDAKHRLVARAIRGLHAKGAPADVVTVGDVLRQSPEPRVPDTFLLDLTHQVASGANLEHYAEIVREASARRRIIRAAETIRILAGDPGNSLSDLAALQEEAMQGAMGPSTAGMSTASDSIRQLMKQIESKEVSRGLEMGFLDWDALTQGLEPGTLNLLAGLQSQGKSTLALNAVLNIAKRGHPVGILLLEGTKTEWTKRALKCMAKCTWYAGDIPSVERVAEQVMKAANLLDTLPILFDECSCPELPIVVLRARNAVKMHNLKLLVIDYLQLIEVPRCDGIFERISAVSRGLKNLAKLSGIPILALSQFNREGSQTAAKEGGRPMIHHMKGGSALEQDADSVLILHDSFGHLDKNRDGKTGSFSLTWFKEQFRFESNMMENGDFAPAPDWQRRFGGDE